MYRVLYDQTVTDVAHAWYDPPPLARAPAMTSPEKPIPRICSNPVAKSTTLVSLSPIMANPERGTVQRDESQVKRGKRRVGFLEMDG